MKDVYKSKVGDIIESSNSRAKIVLEMLEGKRPSDPQVAKTYLRHILNGLDNIQEIVDIS